MEFVHRADVRPARLGILPAAFNPVTVAHLEIARAALSFVDEVVFVLPRSLPHKDYFGASMAERVEMLQAAIRGFGSFSVAISNQGLFVEIAAECRQAYGDTVRLTFLCGRDAAERIAGWDYGRPGAFAGMLREFDLLVAARQGEYTPDPEFRDAIVRLCLEGDFDAVSASEVRDRIARGEAWEHLVPLAIRDMAREIYSRPTGASRD